MSAFATVKHSSRPTADAQLSQRKVEIETLRPAKKRVVAGLSKTETTPQTQDLSQTQSSSGYQDASSTGFVQLTYVDENKQGFLHKNEKVPLQGLPKVTGSQINDRDRVKPQDSLPDRTPSSLIQKVTLHSSDTEVSILYQGSAQQLSTFIPTKKNVIGEAAEDWTIRLHETDVNWYQIAKVFIS